MKILRNIVIIACVIGALVFAKFKFFPSDTPKSAQARPATGGGGGASNVTGAGGGQPVAVSGYVVSPEELDNKIFATGSIIANEEVNLSPEISGKIVKLYFREGASVSRGQLLVKINDADLQAQMKKIEVQVKLAQEKEARFKQLLAIQGISQEEYDAVLNALNSLLADIQVIKAQIAKTEIRAPFDGVVGLKSVSEGSYVSPNATIAGIQQLNPIKIDFAVPEKYLGKVQTGNIITFSVEGLEESFKGKVYATEPKIDPNTRTLQIRATCPNPKQKILPGSFARIELILDRTEKAIMVPTEAIIPVLKGQKVMVNEGGKVKEVSIQAGLRTSTKVEVLSGLSMGDTVITTGLMQLRQGAPVKVSVVN